MRYFYNKSPRVPRSLLSYYRAGVIVGAACEAGEVFRKVSEVYRTKHRSYEKSGRGDADLAMKSLARFLTIIWKFNRCATTGS